MFFAGKAQCMKISKLVFVSLGFVLIACGTTSPAPVPSPAETKSLPTPTPSTKMTRVKLTTRDKVTLSGTLFGEGKVAVILAHQGTPGADQQSWHPFARLLAERGYTALALDFRGVGLSEGKLGYGNLALDVNAAVEFLRGQGYEKIICVGASMGGTACIRSARDDSFAGLVVLASTMVAGTGSDSLTITSDDLANLTQPKLFISADSDYYTVVSDTKRMHELSPEPKSLVWLPGTAHGTLLFDTDAGKELTARLLAFVDELGKQTFLQTIAPENADKVELLRTLEIPGYSRGQISQCSLAFSPDGQLLVGACGRNKVPVWDVATGQVRRLLYDNPQQIVACAFHPDGKTIACGGLDRMITFWDAATGTKIRDLGSLASPVWDLNFSANGQQLVSATLAGNVCLWDVSRSETVWCYEGEKAYLSAAISPSRKTLTYGGRWGDAGILDGNTGQRIIELIKLTNPVGDVTFSVTGKMLAAGTDDNTIYLWNAESFHPIKVFQGHQGYVNGVGFSPDETLLVSGSHDKRVGIWSIARQQLIKLLDGHQDTVLRVAFGSDGRLIASISWDGTVRLWGIGK